MYSPNNSLQWQQNFEIELDPIKNDDFKETASMGMSVTNNSKVTIDDV